MRQTLLWLDSVRRAIACLQSAAIVHTCILAYFVHICRIEVGLLGDDDRANLLRLKMKGTPMSREVTIKRQHMCGHIEMIRVGEKRMSVSLED